VLICVVVEGKLTRHVVKLSVVNVAAEISASAWYIGPA
jgi:hypothetical protein